MEKEGEKKREMARGRKSKRELERVKLKDREMEYQTFCVLN